MATMQRARATLKVKKRVTASVVGRAKAVRDGFAGNTSKFGSPDPTPAAIDARITAVDDAEELVRKKVPGAAAARNVERSGLVRMLETALTYVQQIADTSATYEEAVATIEAAGLKVALVPQRHKQILTVAHGAQSGSVILVAFARALGVSRTRRSLLNWQCTSDGKTFISLPSTTKARTTVANLTPLTAYGFRVSVSDSDGNMGEWSQVVTFIVH